MICASDVRHTKYLPLDDRNKNLTGQGGGEGGDGMLVERAVATSGQPMLPVLGLGTCP